MHMQRGGQTNLCAGGSNMSSYHAYAKNSTFASTEGEFDDKSAEI